MQMYLPVVADSLRIQAKIDTLMEEFDEGPGI